MSDQMIESIDEQIAELERQKQALATKQKGYEEKVAVLDKLESNITAMFQGIQQLFAEQKRLMAKEVGLELPDEDAVVRPQEMLRPSLSAPR